MLTVATFLWGSKYDIDDVIKLRNSLRRHLSQQYRFILITDRMCSIIGLPTYPIPVEDRHLLTMNGCFARLRLFDPVFQRQIGVQERLVCLDLDTVITGPLDPLFKRPEPFVVLQGCNVSNPCPYNCSMTLLDAGYRPDVWEGFDVKKAHEQPFFDFPDDQGWLSVAIPKAAAWPAGNDGVYAFKKTGWPRASDQLPEDSRIVFFPGWRSPQQFEHLAWVRANWR